MLNVLLWSHKSNAKQVVHPKKLHRSTSIQLSFPIQSRRRARPQYSHDNHKCNSQSSESTFRNICGLFSSLLHDSAQIHSSWFKAKGNFAPKTPLNRRKESLRTWNCSLQISKIPVTVGMRQNCFQNGFDNRKAVKLI